MEMQRDDKVTLRFLGRGLQALGWGLLAIVAVVLVIPAAWGAVALYRWFVRNLVFSDGTKASFEGRGGEIWLYFVIAAVLSFLPQFSQVFPEDQQLTVLVIFILLSIPINVAIGLKIFRWFISKIRLSCGTPLSFDGSYGGFLGWTVVLYLSFLTIIGWAWVGVAMLRWICRNIKGGEHELVFVGSGWGFLWRYVLMALGSIFIIPIPWLAVWLTRWFVRNSEIHRGP
jgi:hypothetical protein